MPIIKGVDVPNYAIETFDENGYSIALRREDTLKRAKEMARYMVSEHYKNIIETERDAARVEIRRYSGNGDYDEVVWDKQIS